MNCLRTDLVAESGSLCVSYFFSGTHCWMRKGHDIVRYIFLVGIHLLLKHVHFCVDVCLYYLSILISSIQYEERILDSGCKYGKCSIIPN